MTHMDFPKIAKREHGIAGIELVNQFFFDKAKGPDTARIEASLPEIEKCAKTLDEAVAGTGYLVGNAITFAAMNVIPMLATFQGFPAGKEMIGKFPKLSAYVDSITGRDSYKNTAPPPRN